MDRCQLLGGLIESLEIQYPLDSFAELMQRFQVIMFEMQNIVIRQTTKSHAIAILDFIHSDFLENMIKSTIPLVVVLLLRLLSFALSCSDESNNALICFKPNILGRLLHKYPFNSYSSKAELAKLINCITKRCSKELNDFVIDQEYVEMYISVLEGTDVLLKTTSFLLLHA